MWIIVFATINILLLVFSIFFLLPKESYKKIPMNLQDIINKIYKHLIPIIIIITIVAIHLIEVNFIDEPVTKFLGTEQTNTELINNFEKDTVYWFSQYWTPVLLYFFVIIYIVIYPFTLWFSPLYFILGNKKKAMKSLAYGLLLIYLIALPFYLLFPVKNVYTFYESGSALETAIPSIETFFYSTTTANNCFPSLHTAMTILIAYCISLTGNKKLTYFAYLVMICVIISVIYLSIHWITDTIAGAILALFAISIIRKKIKG